LVENGADVLSENSDSKTAYDLIPSGRWNSEEMKVYLTEAMDARRNHGFKREMLRDNEEDEEDEDGDNI